MTRPRMFKPVASEPGRLTYQVVRDVVRATVDEGSFGPGEQLPATKALAVELGVSLVTVHRALQELVAAGVLRRGQGRGTFVHEEYQERSGISVGLRLGLMFHAECSLADSYHSQVLEGIRRGAAEYGADLVILQFGEDRRNECHGFLYVNPFAEQLERLPRQAAKRPTAESTAKTPPIVVVGASWEQANVWSVDTDNLDLSRQAVAHMVGLGHRRLGFVGAGDQTSNSRDREHGFTAAAAALGVKIEAAHVLCASGWKLDVNDEVHLRRMLVSSDRPTAVIAGGFSLAMGVYQACRQLGLRIPEDVSVIGIDDVRTAAHVTPALTAMRQPLMEMGRQASLLLLSLIQGRSTPVPPTMPGPMPRTLLKAELLVRGSATPFGESSLYQPGGVLSDETPETTRTSG